jgi:transcriptional regulator of acetoin/glycerol metabolism
MNALSRKTPALLDYSPEIYLRERLIARDLGIRRTTLWRYLKDDRFQADKAADVSG